MHSSTVVLIVTRIGTYESQTSQPHKGTVRFFQDLKVKPVEYGSFLSTLLPDGHQQRYLYPKEGVKVPFHWGPEISQ